MFLFCIFCMCLHWRINVIIIIIITIIITIHYHYHYQVFNTIIIIYYPLSIIVISLLFFLFGLIQCNGGTINFTYDMIYDMKRCNKKYSTVIFRQTKFIIKHYNKDKPHCTNRANNNLSLIVGKL